MKKLFIVAILVLFSAVVVKAEVTLPIAPEDMERIACSNCQAQSTQLDAIVKALFKKTGCEFKNGQVVCPDSEKVEDEKTTP